MPALAEIVDLIHSWFPPETAEEWDAVGLVSGAPEDRVERVMFAVDPTLEVAQEAAEWDADLLVVHHPLYLRGTTTIAATTPKGRTLTTLNRAGCALLTAHTNADRAVDGVSAAMASALGLAEQRPLASVKEDGVTGIGRIGTVAPTTLQEFAETVAGVLPQTAHGVRVAGDPSRRIETVALCGGAGDFLLGDPVLDAADVYVTSDLRHHPAQEFLERGTGALIDVAHSAAEWLWLPATAARLAEAIRVETRVSTLVTDPWTFRI
ncbi:Nif3-like dinuclear metal center hexameric protein [Nocardioides sp. Kera G14]|uniref:Nif3-like dinuclear metal center hexameric protein n=1 Tax=Nocardioides sp. Kera G14 TaxID=2884264 RepID=UPI001D103A9A|nr:Nif3-like dinuclear metal center hexameric protein [Nocardioides sp. Kera G14]UDY24884.1 Nif3-like dinuclear metal center hexameric protein [Nocardioides sp. Kera G14]